MYCMHVFVAVIRVKSENKHIRGVFAVHGAACPVPDMLQIEPRGLVTAVSLILVYVSVTLTTDLCNCKSKQLFYSQGNETFNV